MTQHPLKKIKIPSASCVTPRAARPTHKHPTTHNRRRSSPIGSIYTRPLTHCAEHLVTLWNTPPRGGKYKPQKVKTQGPATCKLLNTTRKVDTQEMITHTYTTSKRHTYTHEGLRYTYYRWWGKKCGLRGGI